MSGSETIPRRIIQTGKTRELTLREQAAVANIRLLNPTFEYRYFTDADIQLFVEQEFPQYRNDFDRFPHPIQRIDFFRYLAVFRLGGFYFDLDVFLARGIDDLTRASCVFPFEELTISNYLRRSLNIDWEIGNYAFGAAAEHPFLAEIIENCLRGQRDPAWRSLMNQGLPMLFRGGFDVLNSTGPGMVTRTLGENPASARNVTILFPHNVCEPHTWHCFGNYGIHLMAASWRSRGNYIKRRLALLWETRLRRRLLIESQAAGEKRVFPLPTEG